MKTLKDLCAAADKINEFGKQFCARHYSTASKAWKFESNCSLAAVAAMVGDDEGGPLEPTSTPVGETRLTVDVEFFRHDKTPANADAAESEVIGFAESLGFTVKHEPHVGSGEYGSINQLVLT